MAEKAVVCHAGREEYGIPVSFVISIEKIEQVNHIPHLPAYMRGIIKSRGNLIPVLDLGGILYNEETSIDEQVRMIVIHTDELSFGLLVKEAKEILEIQAEDLKQIGFVAYRNTKYFSAVASLDERLITMIDPISMLEVLDGVKEIKEYMKKQQQA